MQVSEIIKIGTRGSKLALKQASMVAAALSDIKTNIITIKTSGDIDQVSPLHEIGGKELFTKEIDQALLDGEIDIAVHSLKDVSGIINDKITIAAVLPREDVRDSLIGGESIATLPSRSRVGTSSPRRKAQLFALRNDLEILDIRGNVETRIGKVISGDYDAIILATAGLKRLELIEYINPISTSDMIPAIGQAAIAITCRTNDVKAQELLSYINHHESYITTMAEREVLKTYGADCHTPIAAHAVVEGDEIVLTGFIASDNYLKSQTIELRDKLDNANILGAEMAEVLKGMKP